jgi:hypothetical protein
MDRRRRGQEVTYGNVFVLDEQAIEEPDDGADGEGEGEGQGHELHAPCAHHLALQQPYEKERAL